MRLPVGVNVPDPNQAALMMEMYQEAITKLLKKGDYQIVAGKKLKKKSAWRKLGTAFSLSEVVPTDEHGRPDIDAVVNVVMRAPDGYPLVTRAFVTVQDPQGRLSTGYHEVHVTERCCPSAMGLRCTRGGRHTCCPENCNGRIHWSHPGDGPATSHTRAKNRAISDRIGAGENSAEEMDAGRPQTPRKYQGADAPAPATPIQRSKLERGFPLLAQNTPDTTVQALIKDLGTFPDPTSGRDVVPRDIAHLCKSAKWAGMTYAKLKTRLIEAIGQDQVDALLGDD
jgi:hypothetical protein